MLHEFDHYLDDPDDRKVDDDLVAAEIASGEKRSENLIKHNVAHATQTQQGRIVQYAIRPLSMLKRCLKRDYGVSGALVAHAHGVAHLLQRFVGDGVGLLVAFGEHVAHVIHILGEFLATGAMRLKEAVHRFVTYAFSAPGTGIADLLRRSPSDRDR